jgi:hypothetical protein
MFIIFRSCPTALSCLHGSRIEPNLNAKREARRSLFEAHVAVRVVLDRAQLWLSQGNKSSAPPRRGGSHRTLASAKTEPPRTG